MTTTHDNETVLPPHCEGPDRVVRLTYNSWLEASTALTFKIRDPYQHRHGYLGAYFRAKAKQYIAAKRELWRYQ